MRKQTNEKPESTRSIQDYLSIGYIYLLLLGITSDSIYYGFLGINILSYSSIVDVLLSPIIYLTKNLIFPVFILLLPAISYLLLRYSRSSYLKNKEKFLDNPKYDIERMEKLYSDQGMRRAFLIFSAVIIFSTYMGLGLGGGYKASSIVKNGGYNPKNEIVFNDGEKVRARILGHNSEYLFYVVEKGTNVIIAPIKGNIKKIEKLK